MKFLTQYFQTKLTQAGYPSELDIEWSLSYCQGDGVAFYGDIDDDSLTALFTRYLKECEQLNEVTKQQALNDWEHIWLPQLSAFSRDSGWCSPCIVRNGFALHYSHWNTMELEHDDVASLGIFDNARYGAEFMDAYALNETALAFFAKRLEAFYMWLADDIKSQSRALERIGYKVLELGTVSEVHTYVRNSANYRIELITSPADLQDAWYGYDGTAAEYVEQILNGTMYVNATATIYDRTDDCKLGSSTRCDIEIHETEMDGKGAKPYRYDLVSDAISEVRSRITRHAGLMAH
ncbi:hypothetical protein A1D23_13230 [Chelonobacter oris]|uniref:hypothetical protein n=1 Tax=Chelonobacter oris TaxID=505317 RepID=UPI00244B7CF3|nr:hypothetical protein [Chelonobacter oris]MDH3001507.1 hypothetical protein [Chelonobacter oris]